FLAGVVRLSGDKGLSRLKCVLVLVSATVVPAFAPSRPSPKQADIGIAPTSAKAATERTFPSILDPLMTAYAFSSAEHGQPAVALVLSDHHSAWVFLEFSDLAVTARHEPEIAIVFSFGDMHGAGIERRAIMGDQHQIIE